MTALPIDPRFEPPDDVGRPLEVITILETVPRIWDDGDWAAQARCRPRPGRERITEAFFPARGDGAAIGRQICDLCAVKVPCREFALSNPSVQGTWGGTTDEDRRRIITDRVGAARMTVLGRRGWWLWC